MDPDRPSELAKDKRLLVLLAFGLLIVVVDLGHLLPARGKQDVVWGWVEDCRNDYGLQRVHLDTATSTLPVSAADLRTHRAVSLADAEPGRNVSSRISPRLALLLGLPFPINRASQDELTMLRGIGPKLAARIVSHREARGPFASAQSLRAVSGIGERLAGRLAPQLSFE